MNFLYRLINTTSFADEKDKKEKIFLLQLSELCVIYSLLLFQAFFNFLISYCYKFFSVIG